MPRQPALLEQKRYTAWMLLAALQAAIALALFHDFIFGDKYFAFRDIGSDTIGQFVPTLMYLARPENWTSTWSFSIGLGAASPLTLAPFTLLGIAGGPEHVLDLRIWVYLAKIFAGGAAFYAFAATLSKRRAVALIVALSYSFCGYVMTDGQWDPFSNEFVAYAVLLWALAQHSRKPHRWALALALAYAIYSGAFFVSICVFLVYAFVAASIAADRPLAGALAWLRGALPQCVFGMLLAAPVILPLIFQLLDNPRVTGEQAGFGARLMQLAALNDTRTLLVQLAGLYHKNILGTGNQHIGWMNYLESPGYYVGLLALLLIPQLARGTRRDRRLLGAAVLVLACFAAFPALRYFAYGFGLDYFRINNLWISILLLILFARALEQVAERGIHRPVLAASALALALGLILLAREIPLAVSLNHALKVLLLLVSALVFCLALARPGRWREFVPFALCFIAIEAVLLNYASFHAQRLVQSTRTSSYEDGTAAALAYLKARDPGFYRVEKDYDSISYCDALAQGYMGVKSYWIQSSSVVGFYMELGLLPIKSPIKNFTNWLQSFGDRYVLDSLVGVKYLIARKPLDWSGFRKIGQAGSLSIYENAYALPLAVAYQHQILRKTVDGSPPHLRDVVMMNAAIVEHPRGDQPVLWDPKPLAVERSDWLEVNYHAPARKLQESGLKLERFSQDRIAGSVAVDRFSVLVFSIPYAPGWSITVDGKEQALYKANFGMTAADLAPGKHQVELRYRLPGLLPGLLLGLLSLLVMLALSRRARRA